MKGARVLVPAGSYRVGSSPNFNLNLNRTAIGTVRFTYTEQMHRGPVEYACVDLDDETLPNPSAPGTVQAETAVLTVVELV